MYTQGMNRSKSGWKFKDKTSKTEEHIEQTNTVKKIKKMNETTLSVITNGDESTFLTLMKKFRF